MVNFDTLCWIISWHDRDRNILKILSSSSTLINNTANLDQEVCNNTNVEYSTIDDVEKFEALSDLEDNEEDNKTKVNNSDDHSPDDGVYWLGYNIGIDSSSKLVLLFDHNDIFTNKSPKSHISKLIKKNMVQGSRRSTIKRTAMQYSNVMSLSYSVS